MGIRRMILMEPSNPYQWSDDPFTQVLTRAGIKAITTETLVDVWQFEFIGGAPQKSYNLVLQQVSPTAPGENHPHLAQQLLGRLP